MAEEMITTKDEGKVDEAKADEQKDTEKAEKPHRSVMTS